MPSRTRNFDVLVIGAGIVGLAATRALVQRDPALRVCVLERAPGVASGQSGHNSGVIHSGIYYRPGSLKAELCRTGRERLLAFCREAGVDHRVCGKLLVATSDAEAGRLRRLHDRGRANGLRGLSWLEADEVPGVEPRVRGVAALLVPEAGVVDFREICVALARELVGRGVRFVHGAALESATTRPDSVEVRAGAEEYGAARLLACAGLWADDVARRAGAVQPARIVPFRGEYWGLTPEAAAWVRALVYPVPDPGLPFLGVHLTRDVHDRVEAGPNAVLALAREGYRRSEFDPRFLATLATWPGAWRLAWRQRRSIPAELIRSLSPERTAASLRRMLPELRAHHLRRGPTGVRAQLVDPDGTLVDDFRFVAQGAALHVLNAPSPAATASLAIGEFVADRLLGGGTRPGPGAG